MIGCKPKLLNWLPVLCYGFFDQNYANEQISLGKRFYLNKLVNIHHWTELRY